MAYRRRSSGTTSMRSGSRSTVASRPRKSSKSKSLQTRVNSSGYQQFKDNKTGKWVLTHRRVAEKKVGGKIFHGREVHHIDGNKNNNRSSNLLVVSKEQHRRIHSKKS